MSEHVYRTIEVVGSSPDSSDDAIRRALARASETVRGIGWFEVVQTRGHVEDGEIKHFQVTVKVGFRLEEPDGQGD